MATIEIRKDKRGEFRFTIKSRNGETIATGESYKQKAKALATARGLAGQLAKANVVDLTQPAATKSASSKASSAKPSPAKSGAKKSSTGKPKTAAKKTSSPKTSSPKTSATKTKPATKAATKPAVKASAPAKRGVASAKPAPRPASQSTASKTGAASKRMPTEKRGREADELSPLEAEPIRTPARGRAADVVSRGDETRPTDADDDLDTVAQPEGNDIVRRDQLGDGERIADGVEPEGDDDAAAADGGDDSGADDAGRTVD